MLQLSNDTQFVNWTNLKFWPKGLLFYEIAHMGLFFAGKLGYQVSFFEISQCSMYGTWSNDSNHNIVTHKLPKNDRQHSPIFKH